MTDHYSENILVGAVEAGGTKFNCVIGGGHGHIIMRQSFPTTHPAETLGRAAAFFQQGISVHGPIQALGIAQFGPVAINPADENYGKILLSAKAGWSGTDIVGYFSPLLDVPIAFQSDVNGAAIGEYYFGAAKGIDNFVYIGVGTGIGGGVFVNGQVINNRNHPEIGHMLVPHDRERDAFAGCCPFHQDCLEGLASGSAIRDRWGDSGEELGADHPAWPLEAHYLAILCVNLSCCYAPERIILGGGVMAQQQLLPLIRAQVLSLMRDYIPGVNRAMIERYIVPTSLGGDAGTRGALILAQQAYVAASGPLHSGVR